MSTARRRFDMTPKLYLEVGPDRFHPARLGPMIAAELFEAVSTTFEQMRRRVYDDPEFAAQWDDRLGNAVSDWNATWEEEEGHDSGRAWMWLGVAIAAKCDELDVWVNVMNGEKGIATVYVDTEAIDSAAYNAARQAMLVLAEVVTKPGGNR